MAHPRQHRLHLSLLLLLLLLPPSMAEDEEPISVESPMVTAETGHTVEIQCTTTEDKTPRWFLGGNATGQPPIPEDSSLRIFADAQTGVLTVREAMLNDSGPYLCQTFSTDHSVTVDLKVYDMPSYQTEGIIIIVVCAVLLLMVVGVLVFQHVQRRRQTKKGKAKLQQRLQAQA